MHAGYNRSVLDSLQDNYRAVQRALTGLVVLSLVLLFLAMDRRGTFVDHTRIEPALLDAPVQTPVEPGPTFDFDYAGETYDVRPVAEYVLCGLVVSHNNADGVADIYHDAKSVDTKDIAVIWGPNLESNDFHDVEFWSGSWMAHCRWRRGTTFHKRSLSNNHLITDDPSIRADIARIRVGDQVRVTGLLADYRGRSHPETWRPTSTVRTDEGNGACEVLFVREIEFLARGTPGWYAAGNLALWLVGLLVLVKVGLFAIRIQWAATRSGDPVAPPEE